MVVVGATRDEEELDKAQQVKSMMTFKRGKCMFRPTITYL
jgi:hypothetical protein